VGQPAVAPAEIEFGARWRDAASFYRVVWRPGSGEIVVVSYADGSEETLAHVHAEGDVRALLDGWQAQTHDPGLRWLRSCLGGLS